MINDMDLEYLKTLLESVSDTYGDFVFCMMDRMKEYGNKERYDELVQTIESNPDITTSDIIVMTDYEEIPGVVIVDDD